MNGPDVASGAAPADRLSRFVDLAAGLSLISWGVFGLVMADAPDRWTLVRVCISALNLTAGLLLLLRRTPAQFVRTGDLVAALPSFVLGGLIVRLSEPLQELSYAGNVLFALGAVAALGSLVSLGRSFAIFPVAMQLVARGPYRWLRHPAYASELLMIGGCLAGRPSGLLLGLTGLAVPALMLRIVVEERLLCASSEGYAAYAERVRWRLLPGVW